MKLKINQMDYTGFTFINAGIYQKVAVQDVNILILIIKNMVV